MIRKLKKINIVLRGNLRTMFFLCPECNSDAPKIYDCPVCKGKSKTSFKEWYSKTRELWWKRYKKLHNL